MSASQNELLNASEKRVLVISHGHPDFSLGGGEIAAYNLFKGYSASSRVQHAAFLAAHDAGRGPSGIITRHKDNEWLWEHFNPDYFFMSSSNRYTLLRDFSRFLNYFRPTIVHLHHYWPFGLEFLKTIKDLLPDSVVCLTLHEMQAICVNNGQMVKRHGSNLCNKESFYECMQCFPEFSLEQFWLRKRSYMTYFDYIDLFVSPSHFLRQRYAEWGVDPVKIKVIENGHPPVKQGIKPPASNESSLHPKSRFGYFGQINPYKGLDVLLQAIESLGSNAKGLQLLLHGANLQKQSKDFQRKIQTRIARLQKLDVVYNRGSYRPEEVHRLMKNVDWVVVPSIWWENSPMVIQEAFAAGVPVIASNIGGMAEKVRHGVDGILVQPGDISAWAKALMQASSMTVEWDSLKNNIKIPPSIHECADLHLDLLESHSSMI